MSRAPVFPVSPAAVDSMSIAQQGSDSISAASAAVPRSPALFVPTQPDLALAARSGTEGSPPPHSLTALGVLAGRVGRGEGGRLPTAPSRGGSAAATAQLPLVRAVVPHGSAAADVVGATVRNQSASNSVVQHTPQPPPTVQSGGAGSISSASGSGKSSVLVMPTATATPARLQRCPSRSPDTPVLPTVPTTQPPSANQREAPEDGRAGTAPAEDAAPRADFAVLSHFVWPSTARAAHEAKPPAEPMPIEVPHGTGSPHLHLLPHPPPLLSPPRVSASRIPSLLPPARGHGASLCSAVSCTPSRAERESISVSNGYSHSLLMTRSASQQRLPIMAISFIEASASASAFSSTHAPSEATAVAREAGLPAEGAGKVATTHEEAQSRWWPQHTLRRTERVCGQSQGFASLPCCTTDSVSTVACDRASVATRSAPASRSTHTPPALAIPHVSADAGAAELCARRAPPRPPLCKARANTCAACAPHSDGAVSPAGKPKTARAEECAAQDGTPAQARGTSTRSSSAVATSPVASVHIVPPTVTTVVLDDAPAVKAFAGRQAGHVGVGGPNGVAFLATTPRRCASGSWSLASCAVGVDSAGDEAAEAGAEEGGGAWLSTLGNDAECARCRASQDDGGWVSHTAMCSPLHTQHERYMRALQRQESWALMTMVERESLSRRVRNGLRAAHVCRGGGCRRAGSSAPRPPCGPHEVGEARQPYVPLTLCQFSPCTAPSRTPIASCGDPSLADFLAPHPVSEDATTLWPLPRAPEPWAADARKRTAREEEAEHPTDDEAGGDASASSGGGVGPRPLAQRRQRRWRSVLAASDSATAGTPQPSTGTRPIPAPPLCVAALRAEPRTPSLPQRHGESPCAHSVPKGAAISSSLPSSGATLPCPCQASTQTFPASYSPLSLLSFCAAPYVDPAYEAALLMAAQTMADC